MTLDWQVLAIAFIAISLRLIPVGPDLNNAEIDGQPNPLASAEAKASINIMGVRQRGTDDITAIHVNGSDL
jgi:hypothetical protein